MFTWNSLWHGNRMIWRCWMSRLLVAVCLAWIAPATVTQRPASTAELLQFSTQGHVVGFTAYEFYLTNAAYLLKVEFVNAHSREPISTASHSVSSEAVPFTRVEYSDLWDGITLIYEATNVGLMRSTYRLEPWADARQIRLHYNVPVDLRPDGTLNLAYAAGCLRESAPLAWQEVAGQRVTVPVQFRLLAEQEVGFELGTHDPTYPVWIDPTLTWHTFLGGVSSDIGRAITLDGNGNIYVVGRSSNTWGSPVRAYGGNTDAFVAKLDSAGMLLWNTFLGGATGTDYGEGIAVDSAGNVYGTGYSNATWGTPLRSYSSMNDAFVFKLNSNGQLLWNAFLGGFNDDWGFGIATDGSGNVLMLGNSGAAWGSPIRPNAGNDAFVVKLNSSGTLVWLTFLGGSQSDGGTSLAVNASGDAWVAGYSQGTWGTPLLPYIGSSDIFAARLTTSGTLLWNTFLGGSGTDWVGHEAAAVDGSGNLYVAGYSAGSWGAPIREHGGGTEDAFVFKLDASGGLLWNTFLGGGASDLGYALTVDADGNAYASGRSYSSWGIPVHAYAGGTSDAFVAKLDTGGVLLWHTFVGDTGSDCAYGVALDLAGALYVTGYSDANWGTPIRPYGGGTADAIVAKLDSYRVFNLNTDQGYTAIQPAINAAGTGHVISATPGVYSEPVTVNKNLVLTQPPAAEATISGNLIINSNVTAMLGGAWQVNGTVTNNGALQQTQTVPDGPTTTRFLFIQNAAGTLTPYYGVDITPNSIGLGATTVTIRGNQAACNVGDQLIHRCFDLTATNPQTATVRFWYLNSERGAEDPALMNAYHWSATQGWELLPTAAVPRGTVGSYEWTEAVDVGSYSPFGLADGLPVAPTAVTLQRLSAAPSLNAQAAVNIGFIALGVIGLSAVVTIIRLRRTS